MYIQNRDFDTAVYQSLDHKFPYPATSAGKDSYFPTPVPSCLFTSEPPRIEGDVVQLLVDYSYRAESKTPFQGFHDLRIAPRVPKSGDPTCELASELFRALR